MSEKPSATLPGTVEKIIKSPNPDEPEKAQIAVEGADDLYREIRIDNTLTNEKGDEVSLKVGAQVEVTVEADAEATTPKNRGTQQTVATAHPLKHPEHRDSRHLQYDKQPQREGP